MLKRILKKNTMKHKSYIYIQSWGEMKKNVPMDEFKKKKEKKRENVRKQKKTKQQIPNNKSVVTSSTIPHSGLNKCWNMLSYHKVHEAIASNIV